MTWALDEQLGSRVWGHFGDPLGTLYYGDPLGTLWGLFGDPLGTLWGPFGDPLGTLWGPFGDPLGTLWGPFGGPCGDHFKSMTVFVTHKFQQHDMGLRHELGSRVR
jgi:hypothetical protein